jgi:hypothetical protein
MLRGPLMFLAGSVAVLAVSLAARLTFLADVTPVAWADEPQRLWAVEVAFLLRATEFVAMGSAALACLATAGAISAGTRHTGEPTNGVRRD